MTFKLTELLDKHNTFSMGTLLHSAEIQIFSNSGAIFRKMTEFSWTEEDEDIPVFVDRLRKAGNNRLTGFSYTGFSRCVSIVSISP